jgi:hypothetical protein
MRPATARFPTVDCIESRNRVWAGRGPHEDRLDRAGPASPMRCFAAPLTWSRDSAAPTRPSLQRRHQWSSRPPAAAGSPHRCTPVGRASRTSLASLRTCDHPWLLRSGGVTRTPPVSQCNRTCGRPSIPGGRTADPRTSRPGCVTRPIGSPRGRCPPLGTMSTLIRCAEPWRCKSLAGHRLRLTLRKARRWPTLSLRSRRHRARQFKLDQSWAEASEGGSDGGAWLDGQDADAIACDADRPWRCYRPDHSAGNTASKPEPLSPLPLPLPRPRVPPRARLRPGRSRTLVPWRCSPSPRRRGRCPRWAPPRRECLGRHRG